MVTHGGEVCVYQVDNNESYHVDNNESWRHGATEPQWQTQCDGLARLEPWSGIMVVSTTDLCLEEGPAVDDGDGFGSEGMRRSPWVYQTDCMLLSRQKVTQWCHVFRACGPDDIFTSPIVRLLGFEWWLHILLCMLLTDICWIKSK
jgi:hypothetical protein